MPNDTLIGHLTNRNGRFAVCYATTLHGEPVTLRRFYLSDARVTTDTEAFLGRIVTCRRGDGNTWHVADSTRWLETNGAVETEEEPIPAPRANVPVRWCDGICDHYHYEPRWEKLSKRHGWVPA